MLVFILGFIAGTITTIIAAAVAVGRDDIEEEEFDLNAYQPKHEKKGRDDGEDG